MIDLHCHLLPGIDDGPDSLEQAVSLCRALVNNGITHAVVTPHIHPGRWDNDKSSIEQAYDILTSALSSEPVSLQLAMGAEVRVSDEILGMVLANRIPFLGQWQGKQVMLLEWPHSHIPIGSDKLIEWLIKRDIIPMIAHPERNKDVIRRSEKLQPFIDMGCLFQLTAASVVGNFGEGAQVRAHEFLQAGLVTIVATDAHNEKGRKPLLAEARQEIAAMIDEATATLLVHDNPWEIASDTFAH